MKKTASTVQEHIFKRGMGCYLTSMQLIKFVKSLYILGLLVLPASAAAQDMTEAATDTQTEAEESAAEALGFRQVFGAGMLDAYENKTIEGVYPEYRADIAAGIEPAAFTEFHHDNATTTYEHRGPDQSYTITGIYTVQKDTICYYYNAPGKVVGNFCFYVFIRDSCYFHYYVPEGIPVTAKDFDDWSSMAYAKEDAGTCLPNIS